MNEILLAIARKVIFIALVLGFFYLFDHTVLSNFDTAEKLKDDPKAIALLLGLLSVALAMA